MKYAIKVWYDNTWRFVSEGPVDNLRTMTTSSYEEAAEWRSMWIRNGQRAEIVKYD